MADDTDWGRQIAQNAQRFEQLRRRVAAVSITETSRDGTVRVTVSADGVPIDITLTERRNLMPMAQVSAEIMQCLRRAQARIPDLMRQAMADTIGAPDAGTQQVLADTQARFPPAPPEPPMPRSVARSTPRPAAPLPVPPAQPVVPLVTGRPPQPHDESDWDGRPILEALEGDR